MRNASPLRYPGGKWRIAPFVEKLIRLNDTKRRRYVEPYAGGASLALSLLFRNAVSEIHLNDLDPAIYAFWYSVLNTNSEFLKLVGSTRVTPKEWVRQKEIYKTGPSVGLLALGFATFYLNRTNHSGILNGGMIGGKGQTGTWKIDARFNKAELSRRIRLIGDYAKRIHLSNLDAIPFLQRFKTSTRTTIYLDPPYCRPGADLYLNAYDLKDHAQVRKCVAHLRCPWVVSYDDVPEIRKLYVGTKSRKLKLLHTARSLRRGREIMFFSPQLRVPAYDR
jgi:DNA adenine methylase